MAKRAEGSRLRGRPGILVPVLLSLGVVGSLVAMGASAPPTSSRASEESSELNVRRSDPGRTDPGQSTYQAENPKNNLQLLFSASGLHVSPRGDQPFEWSLDLAFSRLGNQSAVAPEGPGRFSASANRVDYDFGGVKQWYLNSEHALQMGFTILAAPPEEAAGAAAPVTLDLLVSGDLQPRADKPGYFIDLVSPSGDSVLRFGALRATDAKGDTLQAGLETRSGAEGSSPRIRILIDAVDPAYPIVVEAALRAGVPGYPKFETPQGGGTGEMVGVPVTLGEGITETVAEIMARQKGSKPLEPGRPREKKHEYEAELEPQEDPNAPAASHWPPWNSPASTPKSTPISTILPDSPQTLGISFKAIDVTESGFIPPDSMGDVGPTQIVVHLNGRIKTFDKTGLEDGALNATDSVFWSSVAPGDPPGVNDGISDPEIRYDRLSGRWFFLGITIAEAANNKIVLAVSSGPSIFSQASFTFFSFPVGTPSPADATSFCDYPSLGVDANALYTGCNMFTAAGAFRWTSAFVIRKSSVTNFVGPIVVTGFGNITGGCGVTTACGTAPCNVNAGPYAPRGVDNDDPQATEGYFVGTDLCFLGRLEFRRVSNPGGTPTLSSNIALSTITSTNMAPQQASGSTTGVDPSDSRLFAASIHKNRLTGVSSLWTALSVETNTSCVGSGSGGTRRIGARWHEIGNLSATPSITQSGTLCTTVTGANSLNSERGFLYPSVTETGQGHVALSASFASASEFVGVAAAGRLRTDPAAGTRAPESIVLNGSASYTINDPSGRNRWGDYSFTRVDPNDDQTVWTFQEYADSPANRWSVRVAQLLAPPPPALATATPVCTGLASTTTTITGTDSCTAPTCANGLCTGGGVCPEFFDPGPDTGGPGFASHLTATVTGGVTVNPFPATSIIVPGSPSTSRVLQATLSLNTTAATPGTKSVTITNPDGQSRTGVAILTVNPTPATPSPSNNTPICSGQTLQLSAPTVAGATYSWTGPDGFASSLQNPTIPAATAAATGTYNVSVTVNGCPSSPGATSVTVIATGGSCTDNSLCTTGDTCQAGGACTGTAVTCTALDSCHDAGTCDTGTGLCSNPVKADGAPCTDGNGCTQTDTCLAGVCNGSNPVVCSPSDQCHDAGTCDTGSGVCSDPPKEDGSACTDENACTQTDSCQAGACAGSNPVVCTASDQCHDTGVCDTGSGICSNPAKPDGAICEDGNACTQPDTCQTGACQAGPPTDLDSDAHVNSLCGGDDCNDINPLVWQPPIDVTNLTVTSPAHVAWDSQGVSAGPETSYDLVSGTLGPGTGILFTAASCLQPAGPASYDDGRADPATGVSFWYLSRAANSCGVGTYGSPTRDSAIPPCP